ncbi:hypothetical protein ACH5RR_018999 [Cinchona calisaya]|uniref:Uncharacterized protein n=1 Tax=Cinchona calisaya TaxID=153742 RepID=A0ABD2ZN29_9GENT
MRRCAVEVYSGFEIDSFSTGRSLSWKSSRDSLHSLERKKYTETVRRRCSTFTSNGYLLKRMGKSCQRIKHRETRTRELVGTVSSKSRTGFQDFGFVLPFHGIETVYSRTVNIITTIKSWILRQGY